MILIPLLIAERPALLTQVDGRGDQVLQRAAEAVEAPDDDPILVRA
jgi:hypothetical protein